MAKMIVPLDQLPDNEKPTECLPCQYSYRASDAVVALVEDSHPDYKDGTRITGLCGSHAETVDLTNIRNT